MTSSLSAAALPAMSAPSGRPARLNVAVVEKMATFGGTCLNIGCIPRRRCSTPPRCSRRPPRPRGAGRRRRRAEARSQRDDEASRRYVTANVNGVAFLFKKNKITSYIGTGKIAAPGRVEVTAADGKVTTVEAKNIVIATARMSQGCPASRSTRRPSCPQPARWCSTKCQANCWSWVPASSVSSSARSGAGSAARSSWSSFSIGFCPAWTTRWPSRRSVCSSARASLSSSVARWRRSRKRTQASRSLWNLCGR